MSGAFTPLVIERLELELQQLNQLIGGATASGDMAAARMKLMLAQAQALNLRAKTLQGVPDGAVHPCISADSANRRSSCDISRS